MIEYLGQSKMSGFMINLIAYNIERLESVGSNKDDEKVLIAVIKNKISNKLKKQFQTTTVKQNGKEVELKIDNAAQ